MKYNLAVGRRLLSDEDRYYLSVNLELEPGPFEGDPQAQALYAVESNEIEIHSPIWTRAQVVSGLQTLAGSLGLRVRVVFRRQLDQCAFVGRGGGTVVLPEDRTHPSYRRLKPGDFLACTVLHEFAHVVVPCAFPDRPLQSHGPEFVRCYVELLGLVMPTHRARESLGFLGVSMAPRPERYPLHDLTAVAWSQWRNPFLPF